MNTSRVPRVLRASICISIGLIFVAACAAPAPPAATQPSASTAADVEEPESAPTTAVPTEFPTAEPTSAPAETPAPEPTAPRATELPTEAPDEPLPPQPQQVQFEASDGQALEGVYYPAASRPAPVVVLMHWAPGDASHWAEVAYWLQNRGLAGSASASATWLDASWFPPLPERASYAVFAFTFRGCGGGEGCQTYAPEGWLLDAAAAFDVARGLEGVEPELAVAIGASIGSDAAVDSCDESCRGAMALSPGSYLGVPFAEAVSALQEAQPPRPVWCLAAEGDGESAPTCGSASGDMYRPFIYDGSDHGMMLIDPQVEPNVLELMLEFLDLTVGS